MERCYSITLDIYQQKNYSNLVFYSRDRGNSLSISFAEKGQPLSLTDKTVIAKWQDTYRLQTRIEGDQVLVPMDGAPLAGTGRQELTIGLYDEENALTLQKIYYQVLEGLGDMDNIPDQPVDESVVGQLINDMTALNTAEEQRKADEAARKKAEESRATAEKNREQAEENRNLSEESRASNERQREAAEQARTEAYETAEAQRETLYALAEDNRDARYQSAETSRDVSYATAEDNRDSLYQSAEALRQEAFVEAQQSWKPEHDAAYQAAENERNQLYASAENFRDEQYATEESFRSIQFAQQEENRQAAENERQQSEDDRNSAEKLRGDAEEERITQESNRVLNEKERNDNEADRMKAETARETAEEERQQKEQARTDAESKRATAEAARTTAEQERQAAEMQRQENEGTRQSAYLGMNKTFASAISNSVSGETISVNDASPVEHPLDVTVRSKNLFDIGEIGDYFCYVPDVFHYDIRDNALACAKPSPSAITYMLKEMHYMPGQYTLSADFDNTTTGNAEPRVLLKCFDAGGNVITDATIDGFTYNNHYSGYNKVVYGVASQSRFSVSFKIPSTVSYWKVGVIFSSTVEDGEIRYENIQIEIGNTATEYTPYVPPETIKVSRYGKNLLDGKTRETVETQAGITVQYLPDEDCYLLNGTVSTDGVQFYLMRDSIYINDHITCTSEYVSGKITLPEGKIAVFYVGGKNEVSESYSNWIHVKLGETNTSASSVSAKKYIGGTWFYSYQGVSFENYKVRIQVELGRKTETEYEPYKEAQTVIANPDGTVEGLTSVAPNMTLLTDTPGVVIDMTYNADTKTYIDQKIASLQALLLEE